MTLQTPLSKAQGHGAAKTGLTAHIALRVSALALVILFPFFLWFVLYFIGTGRDGFVFWLGQPLCAASMILFLSAAFFHMYFGLNEIIHDYLHKSVTKFSCILANLFLCVGFWFIGTFSVLLIAFR